MRVKGAGFVPRNSVSLRQDLRFRVYGSRFRVNIGAFIRIGFWVKIIQQI